MPASSANSSAASEKPKFLCVNGSNGLPGTWLMAIVASAKPRQKSIEEFLEPSAVIGPRIVFVAAPGFRDFTDCNRNGEVAARQKFLLFRETMPPRPDNETG